MDGDWITETPKLCCLYKHIGSEIMLDSGQICRILHHISITWYIYGIMFLISGKLHHKPGFCGENVSCWTKVVEAAFAWGVSHSTQASQQNGMHVCMFACMYVHAYVICWIDMISICWIDMISIHVRYTRSAAVYLLERCLSIDRSSHRGKVRQIWYIHHDIICDI